MKIYFNKNNTDFAKYRFLSNFYFSPFVLDDRKWPSVEHYYQAMKTSDERIQEVIRLQPRASQAKKKGQIVELRSDWDLIKNIVMKKAVMAKFLQNKRLAQKLLDTGNDELIEYAPWGDLYWGVDKTLQGENNLGKILMDVREFLKKS